MPEPLQSARCSRCDSVLTKSKLILLLGLLLPLCAVFVLLDDVGTSFLWLFVGLGAAQMFGMLWIILEM